MKDAIQLLLLVTILILQVVFTVVSFDNAREITAGDIASIIQVIFIFFGFFIAYRQIVFSNKISEGNKIWEKICALESGYIGYRASIAKKVLDSLEMIEADISGNISDDIFSEYIVGIARIGSEFQIKLERVSDQILYKNIALDRVIETFLKKEKDRIQKIGQDILIACTAKPELCSKETCKLGKELSDRILNDYRKRFELIETIFEDNNYREFKEESRKVLLENNIGK